MHGHMAIVAPTPSPTFNLAQWIGLPTSIIGFGAIIVGATVVVLYIIGLFRKAQADNQEAADKATIFVITSLKEQIKVLEDNVADQQKQLVVQADDIKSMNLKLENLRGENGKLTELLQGRDVNTQQFQKMGMDFMIKTVPVLMTNTLETREAVKKMCGSIDNLVTSLSSRIEAVPITA